MKRSTVIIILLFSISLSYSQEKIDFGHKSVFREINKINNVENTELREIHLSDSIISLYRLQGKFFSSKSYNAETIVKYVYIGRVNTCRAGGCSIANVQNDNLEHEYFDYFILYDKNKKIISLKVFNYAATHGQEISAKGWLKQYVGYDGNYSLDIGKNVDAISGASISVSTINFDIQMKTEILKQIVK